MGQKNGSRFQKENVEKIFQVPAEKNSLACSSLAPTQNGLLALPTLPQAGLRPCSFLRGGFAAEILTPVIICTLR